MLDFDHSLKKANLSVLVGAIVLIGGNLLVGFGAPDIQRQAVTAAGFASTFICLFWLYRREDRERRRVERDQGDR